MPSTPTRRHVLAAVGASVAGLLGGCADSLPTAGSDATSPLQLRLHALDGPLHERHVVDLADTRAPWDERAFAAAVNGSRFTTQHRPPFPRSSEERPAYVRHDGTYYHLDDVVVGQETVTHPVLRLSEIDGADPAEADAVAHDDLPQVDQRAIHVAYMAARARDNPGGVPWGLVQRGGYVFRDEDAIADSSILGDPAVSRVVYRRTVYRVETTTETFHEAVYRPTVEPVAESTAELEQVLRATVVDSRLDPDALSADERAIVREARGSGYRAAFPYPEALNSLLRKLDQRAYIDGNVSKDGMVEDASDFLLTYGDEYYEYRLELVGE